MTADTAHGQLSTLVLVSMEKGCTMKKDKKAEKQIRQFLNQIQIQHRCGLIIADHRAEKEIYKAKFPHLLEIIGPLAKA